MTERIFGGVPQEEPRGDQVSTDETLSDGEWPYEKFEEFQSELASHYPEACEGRGCAMVWERASDLAGYVELRSMTREEAIEAAKEGAAELATECTGPLNGECGWAATKLYEFDSKPNE